MSTNQKNITALLRNSFYKWELYRYINRIGVYTPRVVTHVDGGLGSQMWQFALGYSVSRKTGLPLTLETKFYSKNGKDCNGVKNRYFLLFETFPEIKRLYESSIETSKSYMSFFKDDMERSTYEYTPSLFIPERPVYLSQYYSNVRYIQEFREELIQLFKFAPEMTPEEQCLANEISSTNACMVHIRKGDFIGLSVDVCTDAYYINAIRKMAERKQNVEFYIFSNDESYFEKYIQHHCPGCVFHVIKKRCEEDPRVDFYLMNLCRHAIISNSGFSWMAAWLNEDSDSLVIMPERWNNDPARLESSKNAFYVNQWLKFPV